MAGAFGQVLPGGEQEDAGVPQVAALGQEALGGLARRLLDEAGDGAGAGGLGDGSPGRM